jgi:hypothetical protein
MGFSPRMPVCSGDRFAATAQVYWKIVNEYVTSVLTLAGALTPQQWAEIQSFSVELVQHSLTFKPYLGVGKAQWSRYSSPEIADVATDRQSDGAGGFKNIHPIRVPPAGVQNTPADPQVVQGIQDVTQLAAYVIYHATFFHGWCNDAQLLDGGEIQYASFGLQSRSLPTADTWPNIAPSPEDAALQLFIAEVLAKTRWGYVVQQPDRPGEPPPSALVQAFMNHRAELVAAGVVPEEIRDRINI